MNVKMHIRPMKCTPTMSKYTFVNKLKLQFFIGTAGSLLDQLFGKRDKRACAQGSSELSAQSFLSKTAKLKFFSCLQWFSQMH